MPCDWAFVGCIINVFCVGHDVRLAKASHSVKGSKKKKVQGPSSYQLKNNSIKISIFLGEQFS